MRSYIYGLLLVLTVGIMGCPHPPPVPSPPVDLSGGMVSCGSSVQVAPSDVCDGMFLRTGVACAACHNAWGCYDPIDGIYCVMGSCFADALCSMAKPDTPDAGAAAVKRSPVKH